MRIIKFTVFLVFCAFCNVLIAENVPVEDLSSGIPVEGMTDLNSRQLVQQIQNIVRMNLPGQLDELRQQIQQMQGRLEEQSHNLQIMQKQLSLFYQDLNQRIDSINKSGDVKEEKSSLDVFSSDYKTYNLAFSELGKKEYSQAILLFQKYIDKFPSGKYIANAHYWLGEIYYLQTKIGEAAREMQVVIDQYPRSTKVADAMFRMGAIYNDQGKYEQAFDELMRLKKEYPNSTAARLADQLLPNINKLLRTKRSSL